MIDKSYYIYSNSSRNRTGGNVLQKPPKVCKMQSLPFCCSMFYQDARTDNRQCNINSPKAASNMTERCHVVPPPPHTKAQDSFLDGQS